MITTDPIAAELAAVRAAVPPIGAPAARLEFVAEVAGLSVDTTLRRIATLAASGEVEARHYAGSLWLVRREPIARIEVAEGKSSRFAIEPMWPACSDADLPASAQPGAP